MPTIIVSSGISPKTALFWALFSFYGETNQRHPTASVDSVNASSDNQSERKRGRATKSSDKNERKEEVVGVMPPKKRQRETSEKAVKAAKGNAIWDSGTQ